MDEIMNSSKTLVKYNPNMLKSILLLTLAVSGNFVGETLGCKTRYYMSNNIFVKHAVLIFIIFFTLNFSSTENDHPLDSMKTAFAIWISYLIFTKQNINFTAISAGLIILTYILDSYITYYKNKIEKSDKTDDEKIVSLHKLKNYNKYRDLSFNATIISIIIGFGLYFNDKKQEYGDDFNIITYIFGKVSCDSLQ
jgi:uncharacterized membrane protein